MSSPCGVALPRTAEKIAASYIERLRIRLWGSQHALGTHHLASIAYYAGAPFGLTNINGQTITGWGHTQVYDISCRAYSTHDYPMRPSRALPKTLPRRLYTRIAWCTNQGELPERTIRTAGRGSVFS